MGIILALAHLHPNVPFEHGNLDGVVHDQAREHCIGLCPILQFDAFSLCTCPRLEKIYGWTARLLACGGSSIDLDVGIWL